MAGQRKALIVANDEYEHPGLRRLLAPKADAIALAQVLGDPQIGAFDVQVIHNQPSSVVQAHIEDVFSDSHSDDVLLVHFSCHGLKSESGELFFAARNTRPNRLGSTAVAADFVQRCMRLSRSRSVVLLLDCCYGGAFAQGVTVRASTDVNVLDSFPAGKLGGGRGRAVITASSAMEYAFEGDHLSDDDSRRPSVFTAALVEGLTTGDADRDEDGWVSLNELYEYVFDRVREQNPNQTPSRDVEMQGELYLARSRRQRLRPLPIPPELEAARTDTNLFTRLGAVTELHSRLASENLAMAAGAYDALTTTARTDIRYVAEPAETTLREAAIQPDATVLDFGQIDQRSAAPRRMVRLLGPPIARACTLRVADDWIRVDEVPDGLVVSIMTVGVGTRRGTIELKGHTGEATITVIVDLIPIPANVMPPPRTDPTEIRTTAPPDDLWPGASSVSRPPLPPSAVDPTDQHMVVGETPERRDLAGESAQPLGAPPTTITTHGAKSARRDEGDALYRLLRRAIRGHRDEEIAPDKDLPLAPGSTGPRGDPLEAYVVLGALAGIVIAAAVDPFLGLTVLLADAVGIWTVLLRRARVAATTGEPRTRGETGTPAAIRGSLVPRTRLAKALAVFAGALALTIAVAIFVAVVVSHDGDGSHWRAPTVKRSPMAVLIGHAGAVYGVAFSADGQVLATAGADDTVRLWNVATRQSIATLASKGPGRSLAFSPDGKILATSSSSTSGDGSVLLWNVTTGRTTATLTSKGQGHSLAFSPDGETVATASTVADVVSYDNPVRLWSVVTGRVTATLTGHTNGIECLAFSPDGKSLASGGTGGDPVRLWNVATGQVTASLTSHTTRITGIAFSSDSKSLATASDDGTAQLWNVATGQLTEAFHGSGGAVYGVVFSPNGKTLATASSDGTAQLRDVATGQLTKSLSISADPVYGVAFSPDGKTLATAGGDGTARLWNVAD